MTCLGLGTESQQAKCSGLGLLLLGFVMVLCRFLLWLRALEVMVTLRTLLLTAARITTALLYSHTALHWSRVTVTHPTLLPLHPASSSSRDSR